MRFLVLPGYLQSGKSLAEKGSTFRKLMTKLGHNLEYIDPPMIIQNYHDLPFKLGESPSECDAKWAQIVGSNCNRCYFQQSDQDGYVGFENSYHYLTNYIKTNGPYDGIIGFSQGSAMSLILSNNAELSLKTCITFSGFCFTVSGDANYDRVNINYQIEDIDEYSAKVKIHEAYERYYDGARSNGVKYYHIYGNSDMLVPGIRSKYARWVFGGDEFEFEGGHMIPNKKVFLRDMIGRMGFGVTD